jgi:hypothetical protein
LSSIHILYNHTPTARLRPHPELCCGLDIFNCTEVVLTYCADMNGAPLTRTPPRRSWGRGPPPPGWRRIQARRSTCLPLRAVQRRRVESLVLMLSRSRANRAVEAARRVGGGLIVAALNVGGLRAGAGDPTDAGSERPAGREGDRRAEQRGAPLRGPARRVKQPVRHSARGPSRELSDEGLRLGAQGATQVPSRIF